MFGYWPLVRFTSYLLLYTEKREKKNKSGIKNS